MLTPLESAFTQNGGWGTMLCSYPPRDGAHRFFLFSPVTSHESPVTAVGPIAPAVLRCHNGRVGVRVFGHDGPSTGKHLRLLRCLNKESGQRVRQWLFADCKSCLGHRSKKEAALKGGATRAMDIAG